jgi:hypothetical protein
VQIDFKRSQRADLRDPARLSFNCRSDEIQCSAALACHDSVLFPRASAVTHCHNNSQTPC